MAIVTFNPYPLIGTQLTTGLDTISGALTGTSTVDDLVNEIYNYIQPIYYPTSGGVPVAKRIEVELKSVIYNIINAYSDKVIKKMTWTEQQSNFIGIMLGYITTNGTPINALNTWLQDIQDNISKANQSIEEQTPLLLGIGCGISIYAYWIAKVATPGDWSTFFETSEPHNFANIPFWTVACMEGALIGANASQEGLIAPTTDIISVNIISSLIGALAIGAGKVIFNWVPEILPRDLILENNGKLFGGFSDAIDSGGGNSERGIFGWRKNKGCETNSHCNNVQCTNTCTNTGTCGG